ncbi:MAG TPA: tautomerase family protein, partial [Actinomycetes bacterium]|nr:tautomerase family protein [Actinomycetes bacterium]
RETAVPLVDVTLFEGRSPAQKKELARAICDAFVNIGDARTDTVHVIFREIDPSHWFKSAQLLAEER